MKFTKAIDILTVLGTVIMDSIGDATVNLNGHSLTVSKCTSLDEVDTASTRSHVSGHQRWHKSFGAAVKYLRGYGDISESQTYHQRINTRYQVGDKVTVGLAYSENGVYTSDGFSGPYVVVDQMDGVGDYKIARGDVVYGPDEWDVIINASRLTHR